MALTFLLEKLTGFITLSNKTHCETPRDHTAHSDSSEDGLDPLDTSSALARLNQPQVMAAPTLKHP